MKTSNLILIVLLSVLAPLFILLICAQSNYINAMNDTYINSTGTDASIEAYMSSYGFNVDANNREEPSIIAKINALFAPHYDVIAPLVVYTSQDIYYVYADSIGSETGKVQLKGNRSQLIDTLENLTANDANTTVH